MVTRGIPHYLLGKQQKDEQTHEQQTSIVPCQTRQLVAHVGSIAEFGLYRIQVFDQRLHSLCCCDNRINVVVCGLIELSSIVLAQQLGEAVHDLDQDRAEKILAAVAKHSPEDAFNDLLQRWREQGELEGMELS